MTGGFAVALDYIASQSTLGLLNLFWYTVALEIPRYGLAFLMLGMLAGWRERRARRRVPPPPTVLPRVSVVVVGHNEAEALERCLRSLQEQTLRPSEVVVVSDGSTDAMAGVAARMVRLGLADHALATDLRSGKSAGLNLALHAATGDLVVNVDCDCSFGADALERILAPFADPLVGAVSGDIAPRNGGHSLVAKLQEVEYLLSISVGRRVGHALNQVTCVSGAFGAFRREALLQVGGCDVGGGEDLDLTLRVRAAGWRVAFAPDATCYTDVPARFRGLVRQRLRWERDAIRLRFRKHRRILFGGDPAMGMAEAVHQWDFLVFEFGATVAFPLYLAWLFAMYGDMAVPILLAMQAGLLLLDTAMLAAAALAVPRRVPLSLLLYAPGHAVFSAWVMRPVRLFAFIQEWFLFGSRRDDYVPAEVRRIRKW
ncbi:glycosyltransferase family 2 protein [Paracraurococcus ruber]|uniref:Glycosyltransferase family 2 protein n=1 Tax=Paracraurococcus ruber TaxID=77675 RepID=A0ABS1CTW1_9PROT|nr:glycosyltransferase family 2 protein [Paracraurococcus ruber]MBK1657923.1 hypothetical protein [Paracraurococcus ruber]TDG33115.1 glycosyltransferase family 2 protein [Paracraurococcus ruber]